MCHPVFSQCFQHITESRLLSYLTFYSEAKKTSNFSLTSENSEDGNKKWHKLAFIGGYKFDLEIFYSTYQTYRRGRDL